MRLGCTPEGCGAAHALLEVRREEVHVARVAAEKAARIYLAAEIEGYLIG